MSNERGAEESSYERVCREQGHKVSEVEYHKIMQAEAMMSAKAEIKSVTYKSNSVSLPMETIEGAQVRVSTGRIAQENGNEAPLMSMPSLITRAQWEELKRLGDQAWNEYEKAFPA
jgi:hypothetical protein